MTDITENDRKLIEEVRAKVKQRYTIPREYDTDYNILRWIKGFGEVQGHAWLIRHLRSRKAFNVDEVHKLEDDEIVKHHFPCGLLPSNGRDKVIVIETVGRTDVDGLLKSIQATKFFRYRMKFMEQVYQAMNEQEKITRKRSGAIYIFDLEHIAMDPFLIPTLNGPYRILWGIIMANYPEWIDCALVVNVPTFFNVLWKVFGPIIPDNTRAKVKMLGDNWKQEILNYVEPDHLPEHWGGKLKDENNDPMFRSKVVVPEGKIPQSLYWKNSGVYKILPDTELKSKTVGAGAIGLCSFFVPDPDTILHYYIASNDDYTFGIWFNNCEDETKEIDLTKLDELFPQVEVPGGLAPDDWKFTCEKPGIYHIKFGNEKAWFLSITVKYLFRFTKKDGSPANVVPLNEEKV